jgi:diguanylate cyclase (GGDEF)-like protein
MARTPLQLLTGRRGRVIAALSTACGCAALIVCLFGAVPSWPLVALLAIVLYGVERSPIQLERDVTFSAVGPLNALCCVLLPPLGAAVAAAAAMLADRAHVPRLLTYCGIRVTAVASGSAVAWAIPAHVHASPVAVLATQIFAAEVVSQLTALAGAFAVAAARKPRPQNEPLRAVWTPLLAGMWRVLFGQSALSVPLAIPLIAVVDTQGTLMLALFAVPYLAALRIVVRYHTRLVSLTLELRGHALTDALTRVWNRRGLGIHADELLANAQRDRATVAVVLFDLDHFKKINDHHGHICGDDVLVEASRRLRAELGPDDILARIGGDEFIAIAARENSETSTALAERLSAAVRHITVTTSPGTVTASASAGLAIAPTGRAEPLEALIRQADHALYNAKRFGRGQLAVAQHGSLRSAA